MDWYKVTAGHIVFTLVVKDGIVTAVDSISKWCLKKTFAEVESYYKMMKAQITRL